MSALAPLRRERLMDRAMDAIKQHVISNGLQAGDRLPSEPELAASLGVSRNVVRQALSSLEAVGIVRSEHGRGTFVGEIGATNNVLQHLDFWLDLDNLSRSSQKSRCWRTLLVAPISATKVPRPCSLRTMPTASSEESAWRTTLRLTPSWPASSGSDGR